MGKLRETFDAMTVGQSMAFPQSKLFLVRAEIKSEPNKWLVRPDPTRQDDWRIWRQA